MAPTDRLPIEFPPREALRIYLRRLSVFGITVVISALVGTLFIVGAVAVRRFGADSVLIFAASSAVSALVGSALAYWALATRERANLDSAVAALKSSEAQEVYFVEVLRHVEENLAAIRRVDQKFVAIDANLNQLFTSIRGLNDFVASSKRQVAADRGENASTLTPALRDLWALVDSFGRRLDASQEQTNARMDAIAKSVGDIKVALTTFRERETRDSNFLVESTEAFGSSAPSFVQSSGRYFRQDSDKERPFRGRSSLMDALEKFTQSREISSAYVPYLLLHAHGGSGKTALMARSYADAWGFRSSETVDPSNYLFILNIYFWHHLIEVLARERGRLPDDLERYVSSIIPYGYR